MTDRLEQKQDNVFTCNFKGCDVKQMRGKEE